MRFFFSVWMVCSIILSSCGSQVHEITVMTFNIRMDTPADGENQWAARVPVFKPYMEVTVPDIVGMQEVLHHQLMDMLDMMPGYSYIGSGRDDGRQGGEYSPLFFRDDMFALKDHSQFWLSETPEVPGSRSWDAAITRVVSWAALEDKKSGGMIYVFNTHFDHRGVEARLKSIELLSEKIVEIAGDSPLLVLGDFNISKGSEDYQFMVNNFAGQNGLTNAEYGSKTPLNDAEGTFNGFRTGTEPRVIDFIFVSRHFEVNKFRVDKVIENGIFISDHWPVVAEIAY